MFKKYSISLLAYGLIYFINLITIPIIISLSSERSYGEYVLLINFLTILFSLAPLGLGFRSKRDMPSKQSIQERSEIFFPQFISNLFLSFLIGLLFVISFEFINQTFFENNLKINKLILFIYLVVFTVYSQIQYIFKYTEKYILYNLISVLYPVFFVVFLAIAYFVENKFNLESLITSHVYSLSINCIIFSFFAYKIVGFKPKIYSKESLLWDIKYGSPLLALTVFELIISSSDRFIIASYINVSEVAYYSVAYTIAALMLVFPKVFTISLEPRLMKLVDVGNEIEFKNTFDFSLNLFFVISIPMIAGAYLLGQSAISIFINNAFAENSSNVLSILMLGMFLNGVCILFSCILLAYKKTNSLLYVNAISAILNLLLNLTFFSFFQDIIFAAISFVISYLLFTSIIVKIASSYLDINIFNREFFKIIISVAMTSYFINYLLQFFLVNNFLNLLLQIICFSITYILLLVLLKSTIIMSIINSSYTFLRNKRT